jgi:hypothetical protein
MYWGYGVKGVGKLVFYYYIDRIIVVQFYVSPDKMEELLTRFIQEHKKAVKYIEVRDVVYKDQYSLLKKLGFGLIDSGWIYTYPDIYGEYYRSVRQDDRY